ncbi:hypothetical protein FJ250_07000, partial [bacterium]|nr:hypothetical protein [bacterium]
MAMRVNETSGPDAPRRRPTGALPLAALFLAALSLAALSGCQVNEPAMPTFDTTLSLPLGVERLDVADAVDSEDFLGVGPDGALLLEIEGDPDTLSFDFDLSAEIAAQSMSQGLGSFDLAPVGPLTYGFQLQEVWAPAAGANGLVTVVPAFPLAATSPDQDIPEITSATLAAGAATVTVTNGLPVPISASGGPDQLEIVLEGPGGAFFASFLFAEIAPGAAQTRTFDLAGAVMPDRLRVRLAGGSPGSNGQLVTVNGTDALDVSASFTGLLVSSATAVVGAQSFSTTFASPLPSGYEVTEAVVATGGTTLQVANSMPVPCTATLTWGALRTAGGAPLVQQFTLAAGQTTSRAIDFAGCRLADGGLPLTSLDAAVVVSSPGSGGQPVTMDAGDGLTASLAAAVISFASVTGVVPESVVELEPSVQDIDMPDELTGLELTAARLVLRLETAASLPGRIDLTLRGVSGSGAVRELNIAEVLDQGAGKALTEIVLDEKNSAIVDFLNNLPERVTLAGEVRLGGGGALGTVRAGDMALFTWRITAPFEIVIDDATLRSDPEALDIDSDLRET